MTGRVAFGTIAYLAVLVTPGCNRGRTDVAAPKTSVSPAASLAGSTKPKSLDWPNTAIVSCRFRDVADEAGIRFGYYNAAHGRMHIRETMGGGAAILDFDADGRPDLFFTDGCELPRESNDTEHCSRLFRNRGDWVFEDATDLCRIRDLGYGQGCAVGDFDNDGFDDLCVTHFGSLSLFRNSGDGTWREVTDAAGIDCSLWCTAAAFGDLSGGGGLDLFVTGYLQVGPRPEPVCRDRRGTPTYCGPGNFDGQSFRLFENHGDGSFGDISESAGVVLPQSKGLAAAILDTDDDGKLDLFVVNDAEPAHLFRNLGGYRFEEHALAAGLAYTGSGQVYNGMGIAVGDYDGDGRVDLAVSNFYDKGAVLFRNRGHGSFRDASVQSGLVPATRLRLGFGLQFLDCDNDGGLDLFLANGHISDLRADGTPYGMTAQLFRNTRDGRLREISTEAGPYFATERLGRGVAVGDLDDDGRCDIVISHNSGPVSVLRNETTPVGHFLSIELVGASSSRTAVGARITATCNGREIVRVLPGGGSYLSASDRRILLGLGNAERLNSLDVAWPSGQHARWENLPVDRAVRILEGREVIRFMNADDRTRSESAAMSPADTAPP